MHRWAANRHYYGMSPSLHSAFAHGVLTSAFIQPCGFGPFVLGAENDLPTIKFLAARKHVALLRKLCTYDGGIAELRDGLTEFIYLSMPWNTPYLDFAQCE